MVQLEPAAVDARMARDKTCPNASDEIIGALFRAVIKYFKATWDADQRHLRSLERAAQRESGITASAGDLVTLLHTLVAVWLQHADVCPHSAASLHLLQTSI